MQKLIPEKWLDKVKMSRVIFHWTAGGSRLSSNDLSHYHILIDSEGKVYKGLRNISQNAAPIRPPKDSRTYAAHTARCNAGALSLIIISVV